MVWRRGDEPIGNAGTNGRRRQAELANCVKEAGNMLIENLFWSGWRLSICANINAAAMASFSPSFPFQLAIAGAHGIGIDGKTASQFARAGQPGARAQIAAENGQDNLGDQLSINWDFAAGSKPEPHR